MPGKVETRYARTSDGVYVAYQTWGQGPDLLLVPGFISHLELLHRMAPRSGSSPWPTRPA